MLSKKEVRLIVESFNRSDYVSRGMFRGVEYSKEIKIYNGYDYNTYDLYIIFEWNGNIEIHITARGVFTEYYDLPMIAMKDLIKHQKTLIKEYNQFTSDYKTLRKNHISLIAAY